MSSIRVGSAAAVAAAVIALTSGTAAAGERVIAVDDLYETPFETPLTLPDPLANDNIPPFTTDVEVFFQEQAENGIVDSPSNSYTPNEGFTGTDEFDYIVCWNFEQPEIDAAAIVNPFPDEFDECDSATIFVEVGPPPVTTTTAAPTTSTTVEVTVVVDPTLAPTTTVAAAAAAQLPVTGGGNAGSNLLLGLGVICIGLALVSFGRFRSA